MLTPVEAVYVRLHLWEIKGDIMQRRDLLLGGLSLATVPSAAEARPANWAQTVELPGVDNLHRVTDRLYRGAQPTRKGFSNLEQKLKITTVLDLQVKHSDLPQGEGTKMRFVKAPMVAWHVNDDDGEQLVHALRLIRSGSKSGKVFVHCTHGADRTGTVMALWRMVEQNWTAADAIEEMENGGYHFHDIFSGIPKYLKRVDVAAFRARLDG
jgi:protein tyrosine phosphatase